MVWHEKEKKIYECYLGIKNVRQVAVIMGCSVGAVSESIKLCTNWEKVMHQESRNKALLSLREDDIYKIIDNPSLNTVSLFPEVSTCLRKFNEGTFDLVISSGKYLDIDNLFGILKVMKKDSYFYFFTDAYPIWNFENLRTLLHQVGFRTVKFPFVWVNTSELRESAIHFNNTVNYVMIAMKGCPRIVGSHANTFSCNAVSSTLKLHPDEKPVKLIEEMIRVTLKHRGAILDPFCHSAEVLTAARNLGHDYYGICKREKEWEKVCRRMAR